MRTWTAMSHSMSMSASSGPAPVAPWPRASSQPRGTAWWCSRPAATTRAPSSTCRRRTATRSCIKKTAGEPPATWRSTSSKGVRSAARPSSTGPRASGHPPESSTTGRGRMAWRGSTWRPWHPTSTRSRNVSTCGRAIPSSTSTPTTACCGTAARRSAGTAAWSAGTSTAASRAATAGWVVRSTRSSRCW